MQLQSKKCLLFSAILFIFANVSICEQHRHARVRRIVGGENAELPPEDDPVVYVRYANKFAKIVGIKEDFHYMFRGLRFGQPPINKDRFQRPRRHFLEGNINATVYPDPCLQMGPGGPPNYEKRPVGSEDCLFLNVYTQYLPEGTEGLPVVIWIHGGGFRTGSASQYGVQNLVDKRIVLVTIQYRLGTFGFLSTGTEDFPGNIGLWDMALAIEWARNYIGFFGGNPHKIVIMGQGTGGSSALQIALSNIAKGSVQAVVAMSGTAISHWASENTPQETASEIAEANGCPSQSVVPMIKCLQRVPAASILKADAMMESRRLAFRGFTSGLNGRLGPSPYIEGPYNGRSLPPALQNEPMDDLSSGNVPEIPLLIGVTKDETSKVVNTKYYNEIVTKLFSIPHYMDQVFVQTLQSFTGLNKHTETNASQSRSWKTLNPLQFTNYLRIPRNDISKGLQKIAEATADALFNLPAFLTADLWSKKEESTFLYRFSHVGKAKKGRFFLNGSPLVGNETSDAESTVGHGDDLSYLFEVRELNGSKIESNSTETEEDIKVRRIYTQMIADFARYGKVTVNDQQSAAYKSASNNFIEITSEPKVEKDFRFCEMGLWAGLTQRLQQASCKLYAGVEESIKLGETVFFDTVNVATGGKLPKVPSFVLRPKSHGAEIAEDKEEEDKKSNKHILGKLTPSVSGLPRTPFLPHKKQPESSRNSQLYSLFGI